MSFLSSGVLRYSCEGDPPKIYLEVDPELHRYYLSTVPHIKCQRPRYAPHITVMRSEEPTCKEAWSKYEGLEIRFSYNPVVQVGSTYCWLNCQSNLLTYIRLELGLPSSSHLTRPPDNTNCFHTTLGNFKDSK